MIVMSLFDGISSGRLALSKAGIRVDKYYSSELDKYAIKIAKNNWPENILLGDINNWKNWNIKWSDIDLLIGGSPCQGFSFAGKQLAFSDHRSKLFFIYVDILNHILNVNPNIKFLLENVKMKKEHLDVISKYLNVRPVLINSSLVSAQNRKRYYWANWKFEQPEDRNLKLIDIAEKNVVKKDKSFFIDSKYWKRKKLKKYFERHRKKLMVQLSKVKIVHTSERGRRLTPDGKKRDDKNGTIFRGYEVTNNGKTCTLTTVQKDNYVTENFIIRKLTPIEYERLQTLPDNYTCGVSNTQRYKIIGNGWTINVIVHIFKALNIKVSFI